jgi:hypothetical protein
VGISGSHVRPGLMILVVQPRCMYRTCRSVVVCVDRGPNRERLTIITFWGWWLSVRAEGNAVVCGCGACVCVCVVWVCVVWVCVVCVCGCCIGVWCVCVVCVCLCCVVCVCVDAV